MLQGNNFYLILDDLCFNIVVTKKFLNFFSTRAPANKNEMILMFSFIHPWTEYIVVIKANTELWEKVAP